MKLRLFAALVAAAMLLVSCQKDKNSQQLVDVKVSFSGMEITSTEDDTKAVSETSVTRIVLSVFDASGNAVYTKAQDKDTNLTAFGNISCRIPVGTYSFVAVAYKAKTSTPALTITSPTLASFGAINTPVPTYSTVQSETISGNTTQTVTVAMGKRDNALFKINITDATPSDVESIRITLNPSASAYTDLTLNPTTGLTPSANKYTDTWSKTTEGWTTFTGHTLPLGLLLASNPQQIDILIEALASDNTVLYSRTLSNVSFQPAHRVTATGTLFSPVVGTGFTFDNSVDDDNIPLD